MTLLYRSPLRVYLLLGLLAAFGLYCSWTLSISLFPQSSKPVIGVRLPYGSSTPREFSHIWGSLIENRLRGLSNQYLKIDALETFYRMDGAQFKITFDWGVDSQQALKEVENLIYGLSGAFPREVRNQLRISTWSDNQGFLAISFFSESRSTDEVYNLLDPILTPRLAQVPQATSVGLWNPQKKEMRIELNAEVMAALQIFPHDVEQAIEQATLAQNGGVLMESAGALRIQMPRQAQTVEDLRKIPLVSKTGRAIHLQDVAHVEMRPSLWHQQMFKTNGAPSLILFAEPAAGGNIKAMAENILKVVDEAKSLWPKDIQMRVLVDPSEFIRHAIRNVFFEVTVAALLAVFILFLFVGSFRNVATAAIEIPLSIILAFIFMRWFGVNINLISLGGLALSAGMNVDASVVVMENIFRHFDLYKLKNKGSLTYDQRWRLICQAVGEVRLPIIASTLASIVVFLPLAFTSDLSYALLGDLAKAVVFSHGSSALVALVLVPTIRLHLMKNPSDQDHSPGWLQVPLENLEKFYVRTLNRFIHSRRWQMVVVGGIILSLGLLVAFVLPRLPKEIIGLPETDWLAISIQTQGHTRIQEMEEQSAEVENRLLQKFGQMTAYLFTQVTDPNHTTLLIRLKNKNQMNAFWKDLQEYFQNTPLMSFFIQPWNPSELPIPDPPHLQVSVQGGEPDERLYWGNSLKEKLEQYRYFDRLWQKPEYSLEEEIAIIPHLDQWSLLMSSGAAITFNDLTDISRVATQGKWVGIWSQDNRPYDLNLTYQNNRGENLEELKSFPLGIKGKIIPMQALAQMDRRMGEPPELRVDQQDTVLVNGKWDHNSIKNTPSELEQAISTVKKWMEENREKMGSVTAQILDPQKELNQALRQLIFAVALSIVLIFTTMVLQLGDIISSLLVLVSIPLGIIGVLISLFVFNSTLSLNSVLGIILLNGIAVANSIILVDFFNQLLREGKTPEEAALIAASSRLRPILMTSLTTSMGMMPMAFGMGEGGKVLQPLGIAVSGGLWVSMLLTLYVVPTLQVKYWQRQKKRRAFESYRAQEMMVPLSEVNQ